MPFATTSDGVRLFYESAGQGTAIVFVHEFGGNHWSWEPQASYFSRRHRCITYAARGYPPSDVPEKVEQYSQARAADDIVDVMSAAGLEKAHIVGLSMGAFACLHAALRHPDRVLSAVVAGAGYGSEKEQQEAFRRNSEQVARGFEQRGAEGFAPVYAESASRVQFQEKDPRGWTLFAERLAKHSVLGAANTMRGVQMRRPSLYDLKEELGAMQVPLLIVVGDEDDHSIQPGVFLKRTVPRSGLTMFPKSGHTLNLEEPALFNRVVAEFIAQVEAGRWGVRDPRADPEQIMRTERAMSILELRHIQHPGPASVERTADVAGTPVPLRFVLETGDTVDTAIARGFAAAGCIGGFVTLRGGQCAPFRYVMPAASPDADHVAWYSDTFAPEGPVTIERAGVIVGRRDGKPFVHCHGIWNTRDGMRMGHLLAPDSMVTEPVEAIGIGLKTATFEGLPDSETNFTLFEPIQVTTDDEGRAGVRLLLAKVRPNEDISTAIEAICSDHKITKANVYGIGSLNEVRFTDGRRVDAHATEVLISEGRVADINGQPRASLLIDVVDLDGHVSSGQLVHGDNPVCITFELVIEEVNHS